MLEIVCPVCLNSCPIEPTFASIDCVCGAVFSFETNRWKPNVTYARKLVRIIANDQSVTSKSNNKTGGN